MFPPSTVTDPELVRDLQERAARGQPATLVEDARGWWLRLAPGGAWWVGSVLPHRPARGADLAQRVAAAEEFYRAHGAPPAFQISPPACPDGLDELLAARGYRRECPVSLQVARTVEVLDRLAPGALRVELDDRPSRPWLDTWLAVHAAGGDPGGERELLDRVALPSGYARALVGDDVVAAGRAVADAGWAGVFGMVTLPGARGRGAARAVLAALAEWAAAHHADHVYLQVERGNVAARRLYGRAGFTELCGYHYRIAG
ncbi:GNAT family N-acetyltransferase [Micromonospora sp. C28SCA-DRY-2]|uniref:GNAT family N-acetyltransferase n=1 Tax=Micromonospora sp. C28SCA-DRY-2 TaxID=3059522 RepID=UPI002675AD3B|nr:GNAT family N-acetyltransferase [Micromonospora sp. C28SCA-DRY-2]MDO3704933.1 GNAT family N-acetyltransferase [Micromonospora sp. C28SCA-DRY-2]